MSERTVRLRGIDATREELEKALKELDTIPQIAVGTVVKYPLVELPHIVFNVYCRDGGSFADLLHFSGTRCSAVSLPLPSTVKVLGHLREFSLVHI